jgi:periplasmic divalent cation tolerance protein
MPDFIQINTTSDKKETLQQIGRQLIQQNLAACVQIGGPVESIYRWEGKVEAASEWICSIKTIASKFLDIEKVIRAVHHYDEPEIIGLPIVVGSQGYLKWISDNTNGQ